MRFDLSFQNVSLPSKRMVKSHSVFLVSGRVNISYQRYLYYYTHIVLESLMTGIRSNIFFWVGRVRRRGPHSGAERVFTVFWQVPTPFCSRISDWLNPSSETFHPWSSKCWNIVFGKKKLYSFALNYLELMIFWIFMVFLTKNLSYVMRKEFLKYLL